MLFSLTSSRSLAVSNVDKSKTLTFSFRRSRSKCNEELKLARAYHGSAHFKIALKSLLNHVEIRVLFRYCWQSVQFYWRDFRIFARGQHPHPWRGRYQSKNRV